MNYKDLKLVVHCPTPESLEIVCGVFPRESTNTLPKDTKGLKVYGHNPAYDIKWDTYEEDTVVFIRDGVSKSISYLNDRFFEQFYDPNFLDEYLSFDEFKEKFINQ